LITLVSVQVSPLPALQRLLLPWSVRFFWQKVMTKWRIRASNVS
jgi:hypothetical protein